MNDLFTVGKYLSDRKSEAQIAEETRRKEDPNYDLPAVNADRADVVMALENAIGSLDTRQIAELIERSIPTTRILLERMVEDGEIQRISKINDLWWIIPKEIDSDEESDSVGVTDNHDSTKIVPSIKTIPETKITKGLELTLSNSLDDESKTRRRRGEGTGYVIERLSQGKYHQYHFCWEEHRLNGEIKKRSRYIKTHLVTKIIQMNQERRPIDEILQALNP